MLIQLKDVLKQYSQDCSLRKLYLLVSHIKNIEYEKIILTKKELYLTYQEYKLLSSFINRLKLCEPISKIIGKRAFWKYSFFVNKDVLDPRPESEIIIESVLDIFSKDASFYFLDIGTGSGCLSLSIAKEFPNSQGLGIDVSNKAVAVAEINKKKLGVSNVCLKQIEWSNFHTDKKFNLIVTNPPYIKTSDIEKLENNVKYYDPLIALDGGKSGLEAYKQLAPLMKQWIIPNGIVVLEIGINQLNDINRIFNIQGYDILNVINDLQNIPRVIVLKKSI